LVVVLLAAGLGKAQLTCETAALLLNSAVMMTQIAASTPSQRNLVYTKRFQPSTVGQVLHTLGSWRQAINDTDPTATTASLKIFLGDEKVDQKTTPTPGKRYAPDSTGH